MSNSEDRTERLAFDSKYDLGADIVLYPGADLCMNIVAANKPIITIDRKRNITFAEDVTHTAAALVFWDAVQRTAAYLDPSDPYIQPKLNPVDEYKLLTLEWIEVQNLHIEDDDGHATRLDAISDRLYMVWSELNEGQKKQVEYFASLLHRMGVIKNSPYVGLPLDDQNQRIQNLLNEGRTTSDPLDKDSVYPDIATYYIDEDPEEGATVNLMFRDGKFRTTLLVGTKSITMIASEGSRIAHISRKMRVELLPLLTEMQALDDKNKEGSK